MAALLICGGSSARASASISYAPSAPKVGGSVHFDSNLPTGSNYHYDYVQWDLNDDGVFGDGGQFFAVSTTFSTVGDHRVRVRYSYTYSSCSGGICTQYQVGATDQVVVTVYSGPPQVAVSATPGYVQIGQPVQVQASAQEPNGDTSAFAWSTVVAGVAAPFTSPSFSYAFPTPGTKLITATAQTRYSDPSSAQTSVVVGPDTTVQPIDTPQFSPRTTAEFLFGSSVANVTFQCRLDPVGAAAWERPCGRSRITGLGDGPHRLEVAAIAPSGEADPSPVAYEWTVDTVPPDTTIDGPPDGFVDTASDVSFTFGSPDSGATFQCSLDQAAFAACPGSGPSVRYVGLPDGSHTLRVRAVDRAGNPDPTPAQRSWQTKRPPVLIDADGDGDPAGHDCDDHDPRRAAGKPEIPMDGIDENCDGLDGAFPSLPTPIHIQYRGVNGGLRVTSLLIERPPMGTRVAVECLGSASSCARRRVVRVLRRSRPSLQMRRALGNRVLRPGTVIEVIVRKPEFLGRVRRDRITATGAVTRALCLDPRRVGQRIGFLDPSMKPRAARPGEQCD